MEKQIKLKNAAEALTLFGPRDENLPILEKELGVKIVLRLDTLRISGSNKNLKNALPIIGRILTESRLERTIDKPEGSGGQPNSRSHKPEGNGGQPNSRSQ